MGILSLVARSARNNVSAQWASPGEFLVGTLAMMINNVIYFGGVGLFLFGGRPDNAPQLPYYVAMQAVVFFSWGLLGFFSRGFRDLAVIVETGEFESYLAQPRPAILLAGLSRCDVTCAGDILQGLITMAFLAAWQGPLFGAKVAAAALLSVVGVLALFVVAGAAGFFFRKGGPVAEVLIQGVLVCVGWPLGPKLDGLERALVYATPIALITLLPLDAVFASGPGAWAIALAAACGGLAAALAVFRYGTRFYQGVSAVRMRG